jgi:hypothetical protein
MGCNSGSIESEALVQGRSPMDRHRVMAHEKLPLRTALALNIEGFLSLVYSKNVRSQI